MENDGVMEKIMKINKTLEFTGIKPIGKEDYNKSELIAALEKHLYACTVGAALDVLNALGRKTESEIFYKKWNLNEL